MKHKRLGKGLEALIDVDVEDIDSGIVKFVEIERILPDSSQPRKFFDESSISKLAESIKRVGLLSPIVVKREGENYKIVSGERRFRAAMIAGLKEVPVIVKEKITEKESFEISLIENLHREDLNPIEEAESFKKLIEEFGYTHAQISELIGKDRTYITNSLRLLRLSDFVKECLIKGKITTGHAKVLVGLNEEDQIKICKVILERNLSVREVENLVKKLKTDKKSNTKSVKKIMIFEEFRDYFKNLSERLSAKVDIDVGKRDKGKIIIHFKNKEDLLRILEALK